MTISTGWGWDYHTCALTASGAAYCWGLNSDGQLGNGSIGGHERAPVAVQRGISFSAIGVGAAFSCGLTAGGAAYCWGRGESGQLGNGTVRSSASVPVAVTGSASFSSISVGVALACGLDANGYAYCWGGAPGIPSSPTPKAPPGNLRFRTISPGLNRTCGITTSGATYCWSWADSLPVEVHGAPDLVVISAGTDHVCGLTSAGIAYCWGNNRNGKLGMGNFIDSAGTPTKVATELRFTSIDAGVYHTCAVSADGDGYCWGSNIEWEVGDPTPGSWSVPRRVAGNIKFQSVSAGESYTCALGVDGGGYCWGADPFGNLGTGAPTDYRPRRVIGF